MSPFSELQAEFDARKDQRDFADYQKDIVFGTCCPKVLEAVEKVTNDYGLFAKVSQQGHGIQIKFWDNPSDPCEDLAQWSCTCIEAVANLAGQTQMLNWAWPEVWNIELNHLVLLVETKS